MKIINVDQGSHKWLQIRLGKITGTRLKDVFATNNLPLVDKLIAEELTGQAPEDRVTEAMQRGIEEEPMARKAYEELTEEEVEEVGLCVHDKYEWLALSPD